MRNSGTRKNCYLGRLGYLVLESMLPPGMTAFRLSRRSSPLAQAQYIHDFCHADHIVPYRMSIVTWRAGFPSGRNVLAYRHAGSTGLLWTHNDPKRETACGDHRRVRFFTGVCISISLLSSFWLLRESRHDEEDEECWCG